MKTTLTKDEFEQYIHWMNGNYPYYKHFDNFHDVNIEVINDVDLKKEEESEGTIRWYHKRKLS